jgi:hypothetical protein
VKTIEEQVEFNLGVWLRAISRAEVAYSGTVHDWTHALFSRQSLDELVSNLTPQGSASLRSRLQPLDERFVAATQEDKWCILGEHMNAGAQWYWSRIPTKLTPKAAHWWTPQL